MNVNDLRRRRGSCRNRLETFTRIHRACQVVRNTRFQAGGGGLGEHQNRHGDTGVAQLDALFHNRHGKPARSAGNRRLRGLHSAMAIAIGLHHSTDRGRSSSLL